MQRGFLLISMLAPMNLFAQDSIRTAPLFALELVMGGGGEHVVQARTEPDRMRRIDLAEWFHLGAAIEGSMHGRWSWRGSFTYELAGWESTGGGPTGSAHPDGDRVGLGLGLSWQTLRSRHHQVSIAAELRAVLGMDLRAELQMDTAFTVASFQQAQLFYYPAAVPRTSVAWRYRWGSNDLGLVVRAGVEYFAYTCDRSELSSGLSSFPAGLEPLTGTHSGFAYVVSVGLMGMP
jgi:hypothetical protein